MSVRPGRLCSIDGCGKPEKSRGWCSAHYELWRKHGDPLYRAPLAPEIVRFDRLWIPGVSLGIPGVAECRLWVGTKVRGYGRFSAAGHRPVIAHRWIYEHHVGPIPDGHEVDHTCHNIDTDCAGGPTCLHRSCVNAAHLEPVIAIEHAQRSPHAWANRTHCPQGHPYDEENTHVYDGHRFCRACNREAKRRQRASA